MTGLWDQAFDKLPEEDKKVLRSPQDQSRPVAITIINTVEEKKSYCESKKWALYTNDVGEKVYVRDTLARVTGWVEKFMQVGDTVVQYDPGHAALPWAAVRALLQMTINDCQTFGMMIENVEAISKVVVRYKEIEEQILFRDSQLTRQLSSALIGLYLSALHFLASANRYYSKGSFKRFLHSTVHTASSVAEAPMLSINKQEQEVFKLVSLVQHEFHGTQLTEIKKSLEQSINNSQATNDERRERLSVWINGIHTNQIYDMAIRSRHAGTCEWATQLSQFRAWASTEDSTARLLWMHGPAGFGKTFVSARIIEYLKEQGRYPMAYFFCTAENQLTQDPYAILRSWLTQLLDQDEGIVSVVASTRRSLDMGHTLTHGEMWELFVAIGKVFKGCTFIVDGFDECADIDMGARYSHHEPRNLFLSQLLENLRQTKSRTILMSRDVSDIRKYLGQESHCEDDGVIKTEYAITARDTSADVQSFSESMVNQKLQKKPEEKRLHLASQAAKRSDGMFLWIKLLERKISSTQNMKELEKTVTDMPAGISDAYTSELEKIAILKTEDKEKAVMILRWTLFAVVPLQVKQLAEALFVSKEDLRDYPDDSLPDEWDQGFVDEDYVQERILGKCGSLLQLRATSPDTPLADHTVHFVHFSVKEYLSKLSNTVPLSEWAAKLELKPTDIEETRLSNVCLRYLTLDRFKDLPIDTKRYPFLAYAAWAWYFHSFDNKPSPSTHIMDQTQKAFDPKVSSWKVWTPVMEAKLSEPDLDKWDDEADSQSESYSTTESKASEESQDQSAFASQKVENPMYYASLLGLVDIVKWLEDQGLECSSVGGGRFGFPLQAAVARNHEELVRHFLNRHVDISQKGGQFREAIIAAAAMSSLAIVRLLLEAKADVTAVDNSGWTSLHHAAKRGSVEIVKLLLDHKAEINATTRDSWIIRKSWTAAGLACLLGHKNVLSTLIDRGADINAVDSTATHPLQIAIESDNSDIAEFLWNKLRDMGVDINTLEFHEFTPLELAAAMGNIATVKALIKAGAPVSSRPEPRGDIISPFQSAVANDQITVAKFLLENGANVDDTGKGGMTTLMLAVEGLNQTTVEWLLGLGASMQGILETEQMSLYDIAIMHVGIDMTRLLVRQGCFRIRVEDPEVNSDLPQIHGNDSIVLLAFDGNLDGVVSSLAQSNGSISRYVLSEALHAASARGHLSIVQRLVSSGAKVGFRDINGRSALHHAITHLHLDVASFLAERGAGIYAEDNIGSTPIDLAVRHGLRASDFIQSHMTDLTVGISRRPSLLTATPRQGGNMSSMEVRKAISGSWSGYYTYLCWQDGRRDDFSIEIPEASAQNYEGNNFSNTGEDEVGKFKFHGFVDGIGTVWFVKLYSHLGWLYRGQIDPEKRIFKGTWGSNRKLWFGTFQLAMQKD
ncbi:ankyrin repeat and SOCS box 7 [Fusarium sp. NRRL 52700]|nr:ankyrin repeat and SOCS box 7 [Fusarium sp. NRRL 52700]